ATPTCHGRVPRREREAGASSPAKPGPCALVVRGSVVSPAPKESGDSYEPGASRRARWLCVARRRRTHPSHAPEQDAPGEPAPARRRSSFPAAPPPPGVDQKLDEQSRCLNDGGSWAEWSTADPRCAGPSAQTPGCRRTTTKA